MAMAGNVITPKELHESTVLCIVSATTGVLAHVLYFIRGNFNSHALKIAVFHVVTGSMVTVCLALRYGVCKGTVLATAASLAYLGALFASIAIYRMWFHPLARFPGPVAAKLTKFYGPWLARNGDMHWEHSRILDKYGNIARIAPNELLLRSVDAIQQVHGVHSKCNKTGTFYDFITFKGEANLNSILRREDHRWRRQIWDKALNGRAQERHETVAKETTRTWLSTLAAAKGKPINTSLYSLLIPFDNIGKIGFSHDFGTIKAGVEDRLVDVMETRFKGAGKLGQLAWPLDIVTRLGLDADAKEFDNLIVNLTEERVENESADNEDIMRYFLEDFRSPKPKSFFNRNILYSDASTILIGGTDTIAAVLSYAFHELAKDYTYQIKMRNSIAPFYGKTIPAEFSEKDLENVEYLNAFIDEVLRLYTPVCNNGQRTTPPEGIVVDGVFIPGGTQLTVPVHSIHTFSEFFDEPELFIVERWTTRPELIRDRKAFHPFLTGPFNCVGRRLALCLIRQVITSTVWNYDIEYAPGEYGLDIHTKAINQLILKAGPLFCVFRPRHSDPTNE